MNLVKTPAKDRLVFRYFVSIFFCFNFLTVSNALHASALSDAAASMAPGTWLELDTQGFNSALLQQGSSHLMEFSESMVWDPIKREVHFVSSGHNGTFEHAVYNEASNSWQKRPLPAAIDNARVHNYDHMAINPNRREMYFRGFNLNYVWVYNLDSQSWSNTAPMTFGAWQVAGGLTWFPATDRLVFLDGAAGVDSYNANNNSWSNLSGRLGGLGVYNNFAEALPGKNVVIMGGGGGNSTIYQLDANGNIQQRTSAPGAMGTAASVTTHDPVSGNLLAFFDNSYYEYNPTNDQWSQLGGTPPVSNYGPVPGIHGAVAAPISTHGVVMFGVYNFNSSKVFLYKHAQGSGTAPPPPTPSAIITSFTASSNQINAGDSVALTWASLNADSCSASGAWSGSVNTSDSVTITPSASGAYTLTCSGSGGSDVDTLNINVSTPNSGGGGNASDAYNDFLARSSAPGVVFSEGFDSEQPILAKRHPDSRQQYVTFSTGQAASGNGSVQFEIPSNSGANSSGSWKTNFADDNYSIKFGAGDDLYVQWRQRFSSSMLSTIYNVTSGPGGWKQVIIGEGDYQGFQYGDAGEVSSCTPLEVVVVNANQRFFPIAYHNCGVYQGFYESYAGSYFKLQNAIDAGPNVNPIQSRFVLYPFEPSNVTQLRPGSPAFPYYPDEWMTFQMRIAPGPLGTAADSLTGGVASGFTNSTVEMWVAREGQPSVKVVSYSGVVLRRNSGAAASDEKYGKVWLTPYHTNKDPGQSHATGYTWYDELIVSSNRIADPGFPSSGGSGENPTPTPTPAPSFTQFQASPSVIEEGQTTTLSWSVSNATSCTASSGPWNGTKATSGSQGVQPNSSATYQLTCSGAGGTVSQSVSVTVNSVTPNQAPAKPELPNFGPVALNNYQFDVRFAYSDPDLDPLLRSEWQISSTQGSWTGSNLLADLAVESSTSVTLPIGLFDPNTTYWIRTRHVDQRSLASEWSDAASFTTEMQSSSDTNGDGVVDIYEVVGPVDTNNNGVDDSNEADVCNLSDAETSSAIGFESNTGSIGCHTSHESSEIPGNESFDYGMFTYTVRDLPISSPGATADITVYFPEPLPANTQWRKYDPITGDVMDYSSFVTISGNTAVVRLQDGGVGDADGVINGVIVDPSGPVAGSGSGGSGSSGGSGGSSSSEDDGGSGALGLWWLASVWLLFLATRRRCSLH